MGRVDLRLDLYVFGLWKHPCSLVLLPHPVQQLLLHRRVHGFPSCSFFALWSVLQPALDVLFGDLQFVRGLFDCLGLGHQNCLLLLVQRADFVLTFLLDIFGVFEVAAGYLDVGEVFLQRVQVLVGLLIRSEYLMVFVEKGAQKRFLI